jgi:hypothetical protein
VILSSLRTDAIGLERATGWTLKAEGLCKEAVCVPFNASSDGAIDMRDVAARLGMPLVAYERAGIWALGPPSGARAVASAAAPDLELPDLDGRPFRLSSLRGSKVLLLAWAPW